MSNTNTQQLMLEARSPDGHVWRFYADGRTEGFPEGTVIVNHAVRHLQVLQSQLVAAAASVPPVAVDGRNLCGALNPGMVPSKTELRMYNYKPEGA